MKHSVKYVDGFVLVIKKKNLAKYKEAARMGAKSWMKHGALAYKECVGNDMRPNMGGAPVLQFPKLVKLKKDELVVFSYIEYKSKAHRDQVNKKVMKEFDEYHKKHPEHMKDMPFDTKRMAYGGFEVVVGK